MSTGGGGAGLASAAGEKENHMRTGLLAFALLTLIGVGTAAAQAIVSPPKGAPLRSEVLNALRPTVEKETAGPVIFVVQALNVMGEWAYVEADPRRPNGGKIDWRQTKFRRDFEADMFSGLVLALLRKQGGSWKVVELAMGPTDVAWIEWAKQFKLPNDLFKGP
jgi:hypothetical protein